MIGDDEFQHTEKREGTRHPENTIYDGDWKLNIHTSKTSGFGMRRYHKHDDEWYTVQMMQKGGWMCNKCGTKTPDTMEGYIHLARWASHS